MNNKRTLTLPLAVWILTQAFNTAWAVAPPNPTASDNGSNTAGGTGALIRNDIGSANTAFGIEALTTNTTGSSNVAFGSISLRSNTTGFFNTATGAQSLFLNTTGGFNTACGGSALFGNTTGSNNTAVGFSALANNKGDRNTASGGSALLRNKGGFNNTASGNYALFNNISGSNNVGLGVQTLFHMASGNNNIALGVNAGFNFLVGNNNVFIANATAVGESNTIRIGSGIHTRTFISGIRSRTTGAANAVPVVIDSNGQLGTINSSVRFKKDIQDMSTTSHKLLELRPVTYRYKQANDDGSNPLEYGLIAEEVAKVYPDLVAYGTDGEIETVQYQKLTPMLVNEVKRLNVALDAEKDRIKEQQQEIASLSQNTQTIVLQDEKIKVQAQEIALLKQQMTVLQSQAKNIEALTSRLSRIEAKDALGMADKAAAKVGRNPG